jgi:hypothetical protein
VLLAEIFPLCLSTILRQIASDPRPFISAAVQPLEAGRSAQGIAVETDAVVFDDDMTSSLCELLRLAISN